MATAVAAWGPPTRSGPGAALLLERRVDGDLLHHVLPPEKMDASTVRRGRANAPFGLRDHSGGTIAGESWAWGVSDRHSAGGPAVGAPEGA